MSKPSEEMTSAEFRRKFCTGGKVKESKPSSPARLSQASATPAQALVEIRIDFQGGYELHYVFAGSELEKYWRAKAAQAAEKTKNP